MADLIAIGTLGIQYLAVVLVINVASSDALPLNAALYLFLFLVGVGLVLWHTKRIAGPPRKWRLLAFYSVAVGLAFFGGDLLIAFVNGQSNPFHFSGGALGLPLTFLLCPGGTFICLAGLARASYIRARTKGGD